MDADFWDTRYRSRGRLFSGNPNGVLVTEIAGVPPGQALDVGCGEGADAVWLAECGWQVTAVDIASTALQRAAAADRSGRIAWARADLNVTPPPADAFDLVSAHYFPLRRLPDHAALRGLLDAVTPAGTFLFVGHDLAGLTPEDTHGIDLADYYQPSDIADLLDNNWSIQINETRKRTTSASHHTHDTVLRAKRLH
ncbi:methyltransferase family protein [Nocardia mexicana]|uniref:Methyltransferase family protein n=2 Tax=Nocardia mexicana TaxID=279262 RepID=A0A370H3B2_9NOCA|nr:methyltransferase family protein [Nocardia mexicana]